MKTQIRIPILFLTAVLMAQLALPAADQTNPASLSRPDGKPADLTKPVKVFILLGQSNMLGMGRVPEGKNAEGSLENAVKVKKKYPYLMDEAGHWTVRNDVRNVRVMVGRGGGMQVFNNEWMTIQGGRIGPEIGIGHHLGNFLDEPVLILKSCIGNRSLGWDLLPPGSERYEAEVTDKQGNKVTKVFAGYKDKPDSWDMDKAKGTATEPPPWVDKKTGKPIEWYAGKQYDDDTANAKKVLAELDQYYPGAKGYEIAGFFFWQGDKDRYNAAHAGRYEVNLVNFIKQLRKDFNAPNAKFVLATLGQTRKGDKSNVNESNILEAQMAVDGNSGKYPEFKGNVATVYSHPLSHGGASNSHYNGNAETYMDIGEAMGQAMVGLLQKKQ
jgi:hypothetical protein